MLPLGPSTNVEMKIKLLEFYAFHAEAIAFFRELPHTQF